MKWLASLARAVLSFRLAARIPGNTSLIAYEEVKGQSTAKLREIRFDPRAERYHESLS